MKKNFKIMITLYTFTILIIIILIIVNHKIMLNFLNGIWHGVRAPIVILLNAIGVGVKFYYNPNLFISYNIGFIFGLFNWNQPRTIYSLRKKKH